ncbi:ABC-type branched-chain amino acid transport systems, periplasmic component [Longilinea arvoryzae]|uniref:non-specific serine/threonine protein kinase n=1 Tax=Longilinea arvoryzae TaxID=360412 RepID=A0A0S7BBX6_9CHLR|nr:ABC transporter substrate-binding protein [Longilinea arvoryzae]GAP12633.1 ABC-type branched-chain amino acid transport systems, periplasmic component [Longilinea arvoryzae]
MPVDRWVGQILGGRYQIEDLIGQGGMSSVYRARDLNLRRTVAIKLIHPHLSDNEEFVRRFKSEATSIARLHHSNIVEVYDLSHEGDQYYMVLQYVEGETLQSRIKRANSAGRRLSIRECLRCLRDVCKAADYAHRNGMIHRDIKPANIMLDAHGSAILMDFGIARILGEQQHHTATGVVLGTALYMSPEQIQGLHPDARSDIYSIGVTLFEALGGQPPFEADSAMTLMHKHLYDPVPDLGQLHPGIPEKVRAIVNRALEKDPTRRFQTCAEMAAALGDALKYLPPEESMPTSATPPAPQAVQPTPPAETRIETPPVKATDTIIETPPIEKATPPAPAEPAPVVPAPLVPAVEPSPATQEPIPTVVSESVPTHARRRWLPWVMGGVVLVAFAVGAYFFFQLGRLVSAPPTPTPTQTPTATATLQTAVQPTATVRVVVPPVTAVPRDVLKIAVLAPLSQPAGVMTRDGVQMAIDEWNARGGVLNMNIVPILLDSQCEPGPAAEVATQAIDQEEVHYIIGEVCSTASVAVSGIANDRGVIMITPSSTNSFVTVTENGKVKPYIFRACFSDPFQGRVAAKFAIENLKLKSAFIIMDENKSYGISLAEVFEQSFTLMSGQIAGKATYPTGETDFSAALAKLVKVKPDLVYLPDDAQVANLVIQQAREKGITLPFLGSNTWNSPDLDKNVANGSFFTGDFSAADPRPEVQGFVEAFGARYKDENGKAVVPDQMAALGYDAANLLLQSISETGVDAAVRVKDTLAHIQFQGVTGQLTFDLEHNPIKSAVIMTIRDGQIVFETLVNP